MEFSNLSADPKIVDRIETFRETPLENEEVPSSLAQHSNESETTGIVKTERVGELKENQQSLNRRLCIIILLVIVIVLVLASVTTVVIVYTPCKEKAAAVVDINGDCDLDLSIEKGRVINMKGTKHGDTAEIECEDGYKLVGTKVVTCLSSNDWYEIPRCIRKQCDTLIKQPHADIKHNNNSTEVGTSLSITCTEGYHILGNASVVCQSNETWSTVPKCEAYDCGLPTTPSNGRIENLNKTKISDTFNVICNEGYSHTGSGIVKCEHDGQWSEAPRCWPISCGLPHIPTNASIVHIDGTTYNSSVSFTCADGFYLNGSQSAYCDSRGTWSNIPTCKIIIDHCKEATCYHDGHCQANKGNFTCICASGYTGLQCESDIDECSSSPCINGICVDSIDGYTCTCDLGYEGMLCNVDTDDCLSGPCVYGKCVDSINNFNCSCYSGFEGALCEINIDECQSKSCLNGTCVDGIANYMCVCSPGFNGSNCENDIDECKSNPCQHGRCIDGFGEYSCICENGYTSPNCDIDIDECSSSPCKHGACIDLLAGYNCSCYPGFEGIHCEIDINECNSNPFLHGRCIDRNSNYICDCLLGYTCSYCENKVDDCNSSPCVHGTCIDGVAQYTCACENGYTNINCNQDIDECSSSPCKHGECIDLLAGYNCSCYPGFEGIHCEKDMYECSSNPCKYGACADLVNSYNCSCYPGFSGLHCEINVDECSSNPCLHGSCADGIDMFTCYCDNGFTGVLCDIDMIDECTSNPCKNGTCVDDVNGYNCSCHPGFTGTFCDIVSGTCNFTTDTCMWQQSLGDTLDWTRQSGCTPSCDTGPSSDYSGYGYYMYIEATGKTKGDYADLISPTLEAQRNYCIQLYTSMYGASMGSISLLVQDTNRTPDELVTFSQSDTRRIWREQNVNINARQNAFKIIIRGVRGTGYTSDAAIDNIDIKHGTC